MKENCLCIQNFISTDTSSENYSRYRKELMTALNDPAILDRSTLLADDAPLKKEAQIIIDAFESVTNGMENPEAISNLDKISSESVLSPWKFITLAIRSFYNQDYSSMNTFLKDIDEDTPPYQLGLMLLHLSGRKDISSPDKAQKRFIRLIQKDRSIFQSTRDLLEDALANNMEELFIETAVLLVREIKRKNAETAEKIALWSIREAAERDFSQTLFLSSYKLIFGQADGLRLFALALGPVEPDISILFWLQSLTSRLRRGDAFRSEIAAYFNIISEEIDNALRNESIHTEEVDFVDGFDNMILRLYEECSTYFPDLVSERNEKVSFDLFHTLKYEIAGGSSNSNTVSGRKTDVHYGQTINRKKQPVQLTLF